MPDFGLGAAGQPALDEVVSTDRLLDALAERLPVEFDDPGDEVLATLLEEWRDELRWPPASALVAENDAVEAVRSGVATHRRAHRGFAAVGSVAATVLCLSGFGAMVADANPGDALYGLHAMLFDAPRVNDDQVVLSAKAELVQVQEMITQGQWDQAQDKLAAVNNTVQTVNDGNRKQDLIDEVNLLNTKVSTRDPNATRKPASGPSTAPSSSAVLSTTATPSAHPSSTPPTTTPPAGRTRSRHSATTTPPSSTGPPATAATSAQSPGQ